MPRGGAFRDVVVIERLTSTGGADRFGNPAGPSWQALMRVFGDLREAGGKELLAGGRLEGPVPATLRLRVTEAARSITAADRVIARGFTWAITGPPMNVGSKGSLLELALERGSAVN